VSRPIKKSTVITLVILLLIFAGSLLLLGYYELDLVQAVVVNAVIQKAPEGYSEQRIEQTFSAARRRAVRENRKEAYLELLFLLSQQLEKLQLLSEDDLEQLLEKVEGIGGRIQNTESRRVHPHVKLTT